VAKEVVAKALDYRSGEISFYARQGSDVRAHCSEDQLKWLVDQITADLLQREIDKAAA